MRHRSRPHLVGMDRRAWPSFYLMPTKEHTSDVEAALGLSQRLTGTVSGRDPAALNGRRRGTKDFLRRGEKPPQSTGTRSKSLPADLVDVFGAASRSYHYSRQTFGADQTISLAHPAGTYCKTKGLFFGIPRYAPLTIQAIDGLCPAPRSCQLKVCETRFLAARRAHAVAIERIDVFLCTRFELRFIFDQIKVRMRT